MPSDGRESASVQSWLCQRGHRAAEACHTTIGGAASPEAGGTRVATEGTSPGTRDVAGYTILEADDFDAALDLARIHPHLNMPGGCEIEVHEAQAVPGM